MSLSSVSTLLSEMPSARRSWHPTRTSTRARGELGHPKCLKMNLANTSLRMWDNHKYRLWIKIFYQLLLKSEIKAEMLNEKITKPSSFHLMEARRVHHHCCRAKSGVLIRGWSSKNSSIQTASSRTLSWAPALQDRELGSALWLIGIETEFWRLASPGGRNPIAMLHTIQTTSLTNKDFISN